MYCTITKTPYTQQIDLSFLNAYRQSLTNIDANGCDKLTYDMLNGTSIAFVDTRDYKLYLCKKYEYSNHNLDIIFKEGSVYDNGKNILDMYIKYLNYFS